MISNADTDLDPDSDSGMEYPLLSAVKYVEDPAELLFDRIGALA